MNIYSKGGKIGLTRDWKNKKWMKRGDAGGVLPAIDMNESEMYMLQSAYTEIKWEL